MRKSLISMVLALSLLGVTPDFKGGFALPAFGGAPALAQQDQNDALRARKKANLIPYGKIKRRAAREFNGRVVGQRVRQYSRDRWVYELRILRQDGQVISVVMDAQTGEVLGTRGR